MAAILSREQLARTYDDVDEPWTVAQDYKDALDGADAGESAPEIAAELDRPTETVRSWVRGERTPNVVKALLAGEEGEWFVEDPDGHSWRALSNLLAAAYAAGRVQSNEGGASYSVTVRCETEYQFSGLTEWYRTLGTMPKVRYRDDDRYGRALYPGENGAALARALSAIGAPVSASAEPTLPAYLRAESTPHARKCEWAITYLAFRGTIEEKGRFRIRLPEERSDTWKRTLADWVGDLLDYEPIDAVTLTDKQVFVDGGAAAELWWRGTVRG